MKDIQDPKELVDSVVDGIIEVAEGPARVLGNVASVAGTYASDVKSNMEKLKSSLPDNPEVIPSCLIKGASHTVKAGIGFFEAIGNGIKDTVDGVKRQIDRATK